MRIDLATRSTSCYASTTNCCLPPPVTRKSAQKMRGTRRKWSALRRTLYEYKPYPTVVMDCCWKVPASNNCAPRFFNGFIDMSAREKHRNLLIDDKTQELLDALLACQNVDCQWKLLGSSDATSMIPVLPVSLVKHGKLMNYFSMVTTTGAPKTVAAEGLRLQCLFPADEKTEARHADLIGARDRLKCDYLPVSRTVFHRR